MHTVARFLILLSLLVAARIAAGDDLQRYSGQALLAPAAAGGERFQVRARLVAGATGAAGRYQLSARLQSDAQTKAVSASCADGLFADSFE